MSVILTAARKNYLKKKDEQLKKKKKARRAAALLAKGSTPPMSSDGTRVWYWELDGVPTTIMYNEEKNELWCNGYILDFYEGYEDDLDVAGFIEFDILLDENGSAHEAKIRRSIDQSGFVYHLYVNGCPIMEHSRSQMAAGPPEILGDMYNQGPLPPEYYSTPPRYEEVVRGHDNGGDYSLVQSFSRQCGFQNTKKNN